MKGGSGMAQYAAAVQTQAKGPRYDVRKLPLPASPE